MNDEKLILLIQANDCLYNKYSAEYKLSDKKKSVWKQIGEEMQLPVELCMKRWACLRDRYAREKRQENISSGSGSIFKSPWHHMKSMEFIDPHIIPRPMRSSLNIIVEISPPTLLVPIPTASEDESPLPIVAFPTTPSVQKRKRHSSDMSEVDNLFSEAVGAFKELCQSEKAEKELKEKTPLHGFGEMILKTIGSMSNKKQVEAMERVTVLVMKMKLEPDD